MSYFYITYINNKYEPGIYTTPIVVDIHQHLLSKGELQKEKISYIPKYITNYTNNYEILNKYFSKYDINTNILQIARKIITFKTQHEFTANNINNFYYTFKIPKRNGRGYRTITAPIDPLKKIQREIADFLVYQLHINPHDAAFGFTLNRDNVKNGEVHRFSKHIINIDLKDFFPSITKKIIKNKLLLIPPFCILNIQSQEFNNVINTSLLNEVFNDIINIATLNDTLPQGSPLSPLLSNLIMIPFDYTIRNLLKQQKISKSYIMYTRYADDMTFSSKSPIFLDKLINFVKQILQEQFGEFIKINENKIKYLKNSNKCYITGVKINQDHNITYGHEKKKELKHQIFQLFVKDINNELSTEEVQEILGKFAYFQKIEPQYAEYVANKYLRKFNSEFTTLAKHFKKYL